MIGPILAALALQPINGLEKLPPQVRSVQNDQIQNQTLFWGTYRPNLFFGTRTRSKNTLMTGLMWQSLNSLELSDKIRHNCEEWENFKRNGYLIHDSRSFGEQVIEDEETNYRIKTQFVKSGTGKHGGDWGVKISGEVIDTTKDAQLSLYYYFGMLGDGEINYISKAADSEGDDDEEEEEEEEEEKPKKNTSDDDDDDSIKFEGNSPELGNFKISVKGGHPYDKLNDANLPPKARLEDIPTSNVLGLKIPDNFIWRVKDFVMNHLVENAEERFKPIVPLMKAGKMGFPNMNYLFQMDNVKMPESNLYVVQKLLNGDFEIDIIFNEDSNIHKPLENKDLTKLTTLLKNKFNVKFDKLFSLKDKKLTKKDIELGKFALSNMLGGIGYFEGDSMVVKGSKVKFGDSETDNDWEDDDDEDEEPSPAKDGGDSDFDLTDPYSLFTAVPSRTFFPRGFLWDEGFHQLLISEWDLELSLKIINSWFDSMTSSGWIPREQILGDEARSRVPKEFQVQNPEFANPPTLYLSIEKFAKKLKVLKHKPVDHVKIDEFDEDINPHKAQKKKHASGHHHDSMDDAELTEAHFEDYEIGLHWLKQLYNQKLKKNYNWYRTTQKGKVPKHLSKANDEVYRWVGRKGDHTLPSGFDDFPRPDASEFELHSDLTSWMGFLAGVMERVAELVKDEEGQKLYKKHREDILSNLKNVFFDKEHGVHCDLGVKGDSSVQEDDDEEEEEEVSSSSNPVERECHIGYPTILPLALELLDVKSPEFKKTLDIISDPDHLWSTHGLRSLSKSSSLYHTGEDYWRGNIWMNVNYLVVRALYHYKQQPSDLSEEIESVYHSLRNNLINTLSTSFKDTNLVWEQYNDDSGKGLRSKPFTGWSSLILLIMSEKYD